MTLIAALALGAGIATQAVVLIVVAATALLIAAAVNGVRVADVLSHVFRDHS